MPKEKLSIVEKQRRQLLRKMANSNGRRIRQQSEEARSRTISEANNLQRILSNREWQKQYSKNDDDYKTKLLAEAIRNVTSVVSASFGLDQPVKYDYHQGSSLQRVLSARTNLKEIQLLINQRRLTDYSEAGIRKSIALLKGATYHEVAHCKWTKNWHTYPFPDGFKLWDYFSAWNLLEDGRIETLLVQKSPIIRSYLLPLIYEVVLNNMGGSVDVAGGMPFLIVRSYLPKGFQRSAIRQCQIEGRDMSLVSEMLNVSRAYQACDTWEAQIPHIIEFDRLMKLWSPGDPATGRGDGEGVPTPVGKHDEMDENPSDNYEPVLVPVDKFDENDWKHDDLTNPTTTQIDKPSDKPNNEGEEEDKSEGEESSEDENSAGDDSPTSSNTDKAQDDQDDSASQSSESTNEDADTGKGATTGNQEWIPRQQTIDEIHKAFEEAVNESVSTYELNEVMGQFNESLRRELRKTFVESEVWTSERQTTVSSLTLGMINALETIVVTPDPSWKYNMDDGSILDLEAFTNRDIGDDSYWIDKDGTGERGHDLAVSLMLDCSGSMDWNLDKLGMVAYAIRKACDHFNIPCTTSVFGSNGYLLWGPNDEPVQATMPNLGGTNVADCLLDIPNQRCDKTRHLVVILTDGEWGDVEALPPFVTNSETTLLVGFSVPVGSLTKRRPDVAVSIGDLLDLPSEVEKGIARFFV